MSAIDVGANQGDSFAMIKSGADIPVISIEGDLSLETQFMENTLNFKDVLLLKTFLTDHRETLDCTYNNIGHNLTIIPGVLSSGDTWLSIHFILRKRREVYVFISFKQLSVRETSIRLRGWEKRKDLYYMDIIVFHSQDDEIAKKFIVGEENYRLKTANE